MYQYKLFALPIKFSMFVCMATYLTKLDFYYQLNKHLWTGKYLLKEKAAIVIRDFVFVFAILTIHI